MNRKLLTAVALAAAPLITAGLAPNAMATVELKLTDITTGSTSTIIGAPDVGGSAVTFNGNVGNWSINLTTGLSSGPGTSIIDLSSIDAKATTADTLRIQLSDNGFTTPTSGFALASSGNLVNCAAGTCTATYNAYFDTGNTLFAETTQIDGPLTSGPLTTGDLYGVSATGSGTSVTPYSLTEDLVLTETASGAVEWSTDSSIRGVVPEPASLTLLGSALVGLGWFGRRRRNAA